MGFKEHLKDVLKVFLIFLLAILIATVFATLSGCSFLQPTSASSVSYYNIGSDYTKAKWMSKSLDRPMFIFFYKDKDGYEQIKNDIEIMNWIDNNGVLIFADLNNDNSKWLLHSVLRVNLKTNFKYCLVTRNSNANFILATQSMGLMEYRIYKREILNAR